MDVDVTKGLIGRRVCGSIELVIGVLLVMGVVQAFDVLSLLSALLFLLTGVLGIASNKRDLVIAYLVTGIICVILLLVTVISTVVVIVAVQNTTEDVDSTIWAIFIAAVVITALGLIVVILGVVFALLPLCSNSDG